MLDQLLQLDTELFLYLNNLGTTTWDNFWMFYTQKYNWIPLYALLIYLLYKQKTNTKLFILLLLVIALMVTFTDQITNVFKYGVERFRPCHNQKINGLIRLIKESCEGLCSTDIVSQHCGGRFGFFSGHSSNTMAAAVFMSLMLGKTYKYLPYFMLIWALAMGYSRIYVGVHYPLDVICGFIFGALSGYLFYKLYTFLTKWLLAKA